jgi:tetratricopeptide (TPR) repeat protein
MLGLFLIGFAWRVLYLQRIARTPLAGDLIDDARAYWVWADTIRLHSLVGTNPSFLGALYPYVLALVRSLVGDGIARVLLVQAAWGSIAAVLLADAARRITSPAVGLVVGLLAAFYQMAVFFDGLILAESLLFALACGLLWQVARVHWEITRSTTFSVTGALIGLLAEGRATAVLLLVPAAFLVFRGSPVPVRALRRAAALVAGTALVVAPFAIRNYATVREWIPFTYSLGYNLAVGNNPDADGTFVWITGSSGRGARVGSADGATELDGREYLRRVKGAALGASASSDYWARGARQYAAAHPGRTTWLVARKLGMLWNRREYPQIENVDEFRSLAGPLGIPVAGEFALIGALAIAGAWFAPRFGAAGSFVLGSALVLTLGTLPFFVTDRYRHQLVPAAFLLAGIAIGQGVRAVATRDRRLALALAATLVTGICIVNLPAPQLSRAKYEWGVAWDLGKRWLRSGRPDLAVREFETAARLEQRKAVRFGNDPMTAMERASFYSNYATALHDTGRDEEALPWYERAVEIAPDNAAAVQALTSAYRAVGRTDAAAALEARLSSLVGGEGRSLEARGWQSARSNQIASAESLFALAVEADPSLHAAWAALIRTQIQRQDLKAARATLARARRAGLPEPTVLGHEALIDALSGDANGARDALAKIPEQSIRTDASLADVVQITRRLLARGP